MNILKLHVVYLLPHHHSVIHPADVTLVFAYSHGTMRYVETDQGFVDLKFVQDRIHNYRITLQEFFNTLNPSEITFIQSLPPRGSFIEYTSLEDGGFTPSILATSPRSSLAPQERGYYIRKRDYDMNTLLGRSLVSLNGLLHRTQYVASGAYLKAVDGEITVKDHRFSSGIMYSPTGKHMFGVPLNTENSFTDEDRYLFKADMGSILKKYSNSDAHTVSMVILGVLHVDIEYTYFPESKMIAINKSEVDLEGILHRYGFILYPDLIKPTDDITANTLGDIDITNHHLNYVVVFDSPKVKVNIIPLPASSCLDRYVTDGHPKYLMRDGKGFHLDYDRDDHEKHSVLTPVMYGTKKDTPPQDNPVLLDPTGYIDMLSVSSSKQFYCVNLGK